MSETTYMGVPISREPIKYRKRANYRLLAASGKSPVTCKECRYSHLIKTKECDPLSGRVTNVRETAIGRCAKRYLKPKEGKPTFKGMVKDDFIVNRNLGRFIDEDFCCGYGLPKVKRKEEKQEAP